MISNALKGRVFSDKSLERMKIAAINRKGDRTSFYGKRHTYETKGKMASKKYIKVKITDLQTKQISLFKGNVEASNFLNIGESTLRRYKNTKTLYLDRYLIEKDELVFEKKKSLRSSIGWAWSWRDWGYKFESYLEQIILLLLLSTRVWFLVTKKMERHCTFIRKRGRSARE